MTFGKSVLVTGAALAALTAGTLAASSASAAKYVVCNRYNECWRVTQKYTEYPADMGVVYHDDTWWTAHDKDAQYRILADPTSDRGWYDKDGDWHPFAVREP